MKENDLKSVFLSVHESEKYGEHLPLTEDNALHVKLCKKLVIFKISLRLLFLETFWSPMSLNYGSLYYYNSLCSTTYDCHIPRVNFNVCVMIL